MKRGFGFTLIELLIVVAIIAILAAIAVPNFLEAQLRAKVGRTKADMRTIATALESYSIDYNGRYPILNGYWGTTYQTNIDRGGICLCWGLTTPVSYLSSVEMPDPFVKIKGHDKYGQTANNNVPGANGAESYTYHYINVPVARWEYNNQHWKMDGRPPYFLISYGPDYAKGPFPSYIMASLNRADAWLLDYAIIKESVLKGWNFDVFQYDSSNGTVSGGDIVRAR